LKPPHSDKLYSFAPLTAYSLRQRITIKSADLGFYSLIRIVGGTVRFETEGAENLESITASGRVPIYATWHDRIFLGTYYLQKQGIVFLTSQSFDGEYIARFLQRFGFGTIRGSSTRGGAKGLVEMIRQMKHGIAMGFTVDGPKGPPYKAKPGPLLLAKKTGNPVIPFIVQPLRYRTAGSWDRLQIPLPFTNAKVIFGDPIFVPENSSEIDLAERLAELQRSLDELTREGEKWRNGKLNA